MLRELPVQPPVTGDVLLGTNEPNRENVIEISCCARRLVRIAVCCRMVSERVNMTAFVNALYRCLSVFLSRLSRFLSRKHTATSIVAVKVGVVPFPKADRLVFSADPQTCVIDFCQTRFCERREAQTWTELRQDKSMPFRFRPNPTNFIVPQRLSNYNLLLLYQHWT